MSELPLEVQQVISQFVGQYQAAVAIAIVATLAAVGVGLAWFVYEKFFTPDESKFIRKAYRKKRALLALAGDDGYCDIQHADWTGSEGALRSPGQGKTKEHFTGMLPRPKEFRDTEVAPLMTDKSKSVEETVKVANYLSQIANRRLLLRGAKVPVWFGYRGKAILTSIYGLIALQIVDEMAKTKIEQFKTLFATVDVLAIKSLFSRQWNESQINANETDAERTGELKAKKFAGKESLILIFALMIMVLVLAIIFIVAAYYMGQPPAPPA